MGFWEEHNAREYCDRKVHGLCRCADTCTPSAQNAPSGCAECGTEGLDVLLGICGSCFEKHLASRHHAVKDRLNGMARY